MKSHTVSMAKESFSCKNVEIIGYLLYRVEYVISTKSKIFLC